jgi:hypothetical protein
MRSQSCGYRTGQLRATVWHGWQLHALVAQFVRLRKTD